MNPFTCVAIFAAGILFDKLMEAADHFVDELPSHD